MPSKPRIAFYWCASCGGCEEAVVDLAEDLLGVVEQVDIVLWPVALDFKRHHVEALPDQSIAAALINGAVRTSEQEEMVRLLRRKSQYLIAFGACAQLGGIPALANQFTLEQILKYVYEDAPTVDNPGRIRPLPAYQDNGHRVTLPVLHHGVRTLDQVVDVDYYLPGCPPTPRLIKQALAALLSGKLPPKGTVLAPDVALCEECPRRQSRPAELALKAFKRPHLTAIDPQQCLLAQGLVCMGPATRAGCEALCVKGNMPCTGCFGGTSRVRDQGAKLLAALASNIEPEAEAEIDQVLQGIPDPVGTFYRYGLAKSLLRKKVERV